MSDLYESYSSHKQVIGPMLSILTNHMVLFSFSHPFLSGSVLAHQVSNKQDVTKSHENGTVETFLKSFVLVII